MKKMFEIEKCINAIKCIYLKQKYMEYFIGFILDNTTDLPK